MSTEEMVSAASEQLENTGVSDEISQKYLTFISDGLDFGIKASYISEILTSVSRWANPLRSLQTIPASSC